MLSCSQQRAVFLRHSLLAGPKSDPDLSPCGTGGPSPADIRHCLDLQKLPTVADHRQRLQGLPAAIAFRSVTSIVNF